MDPRPTDCWLCTLEPEVLDGKLGRPVDGGGGGGSGGPEMSNMELIGGRRWSKKLTLDDALEPVDSVDIWCGREGTRRGAAAPLYVVPASRKSRRMVTTSSWLAALRMRVKMSCASASDRDCR